MVLALDEISEPAMVGEHRRFTFASRSAVLNSKML